MPVIRRRDRRRLPYDIVDVFTDVPFSGNPLAVVHGADGLTTAQLQRLAREFNLSETAFPLEPSEDDRAHGATYALRFFTPVTELPYAGHPSIGTAWLLGQQGRIKPGRVVQACGAGLLPLDLGTDGVRLTGAAPTWGPPVDPTDALAAVGLDRAALDAVAPARRCGVGLGYLVVPVRPPALASCTPDLGRLLAFSHPVSEASGVFLAAWDPATSTARARMFAGDLGTAAEDPATGSAAGSFAVWLAVSGLLPAGESTFAVTQGVEMGRAARIECAVTVEDGRPVATSVAGSAVHVASGTVVIPD